jgi:hypothetical protein
MPVDEAAAGAWTPVKSDTSEIKSFDEAPATMLHLVIRKREALRLALCQ